MPRPKGTPNKSYKDAVSTRLDLARDVYDLVEKHRLQEAMSTRTAALEDLVRRGARRSSRVTTERA